MATNTNKPARERRIWKTPPAEDIRQLQEKDERDQFRHHLAERARELAGNLGLHIDHATISSAQNDANALEAWLHNIEWALAIFLNFIDRIDPEIVRRVAASRAVWPVFSSRNSKVLTHNQEFF